MAACDEDTPIFSAADWNGFDETRQQEILLKYRLTFPEETFVNWCPGLASVLSNDEIKDGLSERGGFPVERKKMKQFSMRITAYLDRLLDGLGTIDWPDSIKEQQRNWIGRSQGASARFSVAGHSEASIEVFTTRLDTIFGATFLVLAPEHELVGQICTEKQRVEVETYVRWAASRSDVERQSEAKKVTGAFTGAFAVNPFNKKKIPIYIADYVLANYGTGAVMAVPSGDQRDWNFAKHFKLKIVQILDAQQDLDKNADPTKSGKYINSGFIDGKTYEEAMPELLKFLEKKKLGRGKIQYRMRNAIFSRQRYWGEPVPIYYKNGLPYLVADKDLPLVLPKIDKYLPTENGEPPLGRADGWLYEGKYPYELSTMPGWAGSSWYFYRYMDAKNNRAFASKSAVNYWKQVDFYIGGSEHAVGHLLYARFWNQFLFDLGLVPEREFAKKLFNPGMIQGRSLFLTLKTGRKLHVNVTLADAQDRLFEDVFKKMLKSDNRFDGIDFSKDVDYKTEENTGKRFAQLSSEVEKMSKSKHNVVNPDDMVAQYGADCYRMYEMFLGPIEVSKPWDTKGITGVQGFFRKFWSLFFSEKTGGFSVNDGAPSRDEMRALHTAIKRLTEDIERFSMNTCISSFMIVTNELKKTNCSKRAILEPLVVMLAPFAPYLAEELWQKLGHETSVCDANWPILDEKWLKTDSINYPVQVNGKLRATIEMPADADQKTVEAAVLALDAVQKWMEGNAPKKLVFIPGRLVNVVV